MYLTYEDTFSTLEQSCVQIHVAPQQILQYLPACRVACSCSSAGLLISSFQYSSPLCVVVCNFLISMKSWRRCHAPALINYYRVVDECEKNMIGWSLRLSSATQKQEILIFVYQQNLVFHLHLSCTKK
ncbi:unnamed protein product [Amoebophrya sp. A25]|nr:unnamed protein product [Amoebophrya sp. A25]|eukprot:GSA25T00019629001.1